MFKALVVYSSRTGETREIAEFIAEGLRFSLVEVEVKNGARISNHRELTGYDAYAFGSSTYHGQMRDSMKQVLLLADRARLAGKAGASFGAFGWSGEAAARIFATMQRVLGMRMVCCPLRLNSVSIEGGRKQAIAYGKELAVLVTGADPE